MQYCRHTLFSNIGLKLKNAHSVLNEPNKPQISTQEGERETLRVVSCQRGLAERDMTLNIPACECQIHLCLSDRERKKERISIFVQGKQKPYKKSFKMCFNAFEKNEQVFQKQKKFFNARGH